MENELKTNSNIKTVRLNEETTMIYKISFGCGRTMFVMKETMVGAETGKGGDE